MSDTSTIWDSANVRGDWNLVGAMLQTGSDLETAVLISLFTDREANLDDIIPDGTENPRGWIGDADQPYKIGSRLWLLDRSKQTNETLNKANGYIIEALQWLIDDGVATRLDVTTQWVTGGFLGARVVIFQKNGTSVPFSYQWVWKAFT